MASGSGLYGEYADTWTCARCDTENDREFCGQCRAQKPYRSARSEEVAAHAAATREGKVRPPRSGTVWAAVLIGLAVLALVGGVPLLRSISDSRQTSADRSKATRLAAAAGRLPAEFHPADAAASAVKVPAVVRSCVLGAVDTGTTQVTAAYRSSTAAEVLVAAQVVDGEGRARDVAATWDSDGYRTCLARQLAAALSATPAGVAPLPSPAIGEQAAADRVVLSLRGGNRLVVDVVAVQSARSIVTLGFAGGTALPDDLRDRVVASVARAL
ncbi:MAG: hypothetical protein JWO37_2943 [Acidimicrobiales bacterium]|nr:hypothetical protein [Acidimicrobiales bacterium]